MMAGLTTGVWTVADLNELGGVDREFLPSMDEDARAELLGHWRRAVERSQGWATRT